MCICMLFGVSVCAYVCMVSVLISGITCTLYIYIVHRCICVWFSACTRMCLHVHVFMHVMYMFVMYILGVHLCSVVCITCVCSMFVQCICV